MITDTRPGTRANRLQSTVRVCVLTTVIFFLLFPKQLDAQKGFSLGLDITLRHTGFTSWTDYQPFHDWTLRPALGLFVNYHFKGWTGIRSGVEFNFYTQKMQRNKNQFIYVGFPLMWMINTNLISKQGTSRNLRPAAYIGFRPMVLARAVHETDIYTEEMKRFTEKFRFELTSGLGLNMRINDQLFMENFIVADLGSPFNTKEYHSTHGTIVNLNVGLKTSLFYWLQTNK